MLRTLSIFISAAFLFFCSFVRAEEAPIPATPTRWITDTVKFLSVETQQSLDKRLEQYEKTSGRRVAVWVGSTAGDGALETWASSAIQAWKVREKAFADGVVMFILTKDRAIDIEVAPGLEKRLPDEFVAQMIWEQMAPRLDKEDNNGAVTAGVEAILAQLDKPVPTPSPNTAPQASPTPVTDSTEDTPSAPEEKDAPAQTSGVVLLVALGGLILLSLAILLAIGWPRRAKKRS
jgi:uncharacterized protein